MKMGNPEVTNFNTDYYSMVKCSSISSRHGIPIDAIALETAIENLACKEYVEQNVATSVLSCVVIFCEGLKFKSLRKRVIRALSPLCSEVEPLQPSVIFPPDFDHKKAASLAVHLFPQFQSSQPQKLENQISPERVFVDYSDSKWFVNWKTISEGFATGCGSDDEITQLGLSDGSNVVLTFSAALKNIKFLTAKCISLHAKRLERLEAERLGAERLGAEEFHDRFRVNKDIRAATPDEVNAVGDSISRLDISKDSDTKPKASTEKSSFPGISECKCGMPLCICEASAPPKESTAPQQLTITSNLTPHSIPKVKKTEPTPKSSGSTSTSSQSTLFNPGHAATSSVDTSSINYEVSGEGLREAIKNGDAAAARKLLNQGVDANYRDKQGSYLLHLAAGCNQTEIAFSLIDNGARLDSKNSKGETPFDCAPDTLQYKMKMKIQEDVKSHGS